MPHAKQHGIDLLGYFRRKTHVRFAEQIGVNVRQKIASVAGTLYECEPHIGMIQQQANRLAAGVARTTYYTYLYHNFYM